MAMPARFQARAPVLELGGGGGEGDVAGAAGAVGRDGQGGVVGLELGLGGVEEQQHRGPEAQEEVAVADAGDAREAEDAGVEGLGGVEVGGVESGFEDGGRTRGFCRWFRG